MKRTIIMSLATVLIFATIGGQVLAASSEYPPIDVRTDKPESRYTLISAISPKFSVTDKKATYSLAANCISSVTSIDATLQLQKYEGGKWSDYGSSWTASSKTNYLATNGTKTVEIGGTYRLKVTIKASNGITTDEATMYTA